MKSKSEDLKRRGFVDEDDVKIFNTFTHEQLIDMVNSNNACERTASIRTLVIKYPLDNNEYIRILLNRLSMENALYTKIEICNVLEKGNKRTAEIMCEYLGKIGSNQHKIIPGCVSKKKSYPLPRDIIARSLGNMDKSIISVLIPHLYIDDRSKASELIDAIGYMIFYNAELVKMEYYHNIMNIFERFVTDDLIIWKIAMCCSAFPLKESKKLIELIKETTTNQTIILEAERSNRIINDKVYPYT